MKEVILQAHRGVSSDYPENTMTAYKAAVYQGYKSIELDVAFTKDNKAVLLHDDTINRTARKTDNTIIEEAVKIGDITYDEALSYSFGLYFSKKYINEKLPLLSDVLGLAEENDIHIKIDNKFERFTDFQKKALFETVNNSNASVGFTVTSVESAGRVLSAASNCEIHYDGIVSEDVLKKLSDIVPKGKLTAWLPLETQDNQWVTTGFATKEQCSMVKKYAKLGLWIINEYADFETAVKWGADVVETNGKIKPVMREGVIADTHMHSDFSHDSECPIADSAAEAAKRGLDIITITDHCDIEYADSLDLHGIFTNAVNAVNNGTYPVTVLAGIEVGEGIWNRKETERILRSNKFEQVIGSVHAVRYNGYTEPYSTIDFSEFDKQETEKYLDTYFDDVLEMADTSDIDILAHITCPLRYINGKYNRSVDCRKYSDKIKAILEVIIKHGIALEVNTSNCGSNYDEFMPEEWIIKMYKDMGGHLITCGADAHISGNVGQGFNRLYAMLRKLGFEYTCYFKDRYIHQCTIKKG